MGICLAAVNILNRSDLVPRQGRGGRSKDGPAFHLARVEAGFSTTGEGAMTREPAWEAVGVLEDEPSLRAAVDELPISGFDRSDFSVVAGRRSVERKFGAHA